MKSRILILGFLLIFINSYKITAQAEAAPSIQKSIVLFESFSNETSKYELDFIEEKETLYFKYISKENKKFGYKAILRHIHPEGIFTLKVGDKTILRILSIHNGKVFVEEKFKGEFRLSNSSNLIDIEMPDEVDEHQLNELIKNLKGILIKEEQKPTQLLELPKTNNN